MTPARWRIALWIAAVGAILYVAWIARSSLVPFGVGAVIAYAMLPLVDRVADALPLRSPEQEGTRRGLAVLIVYLVLGAVLWSVLYLLVPVLANQVEVFIATLPERLQAARALTEQLLQEYRARVPEETRLRMESYLDMLLVAVADAFRAALARSAGLITGTLSALLGYVLIPFWMFYAMRDRYAYARGFKRAVPPALRDDASNTFAIVDHLVSRYIRAQLILGLVVGGAVGVALSLLGVQLSVALGVWAGLTELVPIIGPWLGAIPGLLVVATTRPDLLLPVLALYVVVQQLENSLLVPRVQGEATDIPAGMVIVLLVVAGAAFGFIGLIVAVPVAAILREVFWYADRRLAGATPAEAFAESRAGRSHLEQLERSPGRLAAAWARLRSARAR